MAVAARFSKKLTKSIARVFSTKATIKSDNIQIKKTRQEISEEQINWENEKLFGPLLTKPKKTDKAYKTIAPSNNVINKTILNGRSGKPSYFPLSLDQNTDKLDLNCLAKQILSCNENIKAPSVSAVIQKTMSEENAAVLERWRKGMIKKLGIEGFAQYTKETFATGHALHKNIHDLLSGTPESQLTIEKNIEGYWKSISSILPKITDVLVLEKKLTHPYLNYVGVIDCIAKFQDEIVLIEWKTSQKPKPTLKQTYDNPIQIAAYLGAWNFNPNSIQIDRGIIVISYPTGNKCHVHEMDRQTCHHAWSSWLSRLSDYYQFENFKITEEISNA